MGARGSVCGVGAVRLMLSLLVCPVAADILCANITRLLAQRPALLELQWSLLAAVEARIGLQAWAGAEIRQERPRGFLESDAESDGSSLVVIAARFGQRDPLLARAAWAAALVDAAGRVVGATPAARSAGDSRRRRARSSPPPRGLTRAPLVMQQRAACRSRIAPGAAAPRPLGTRSPHCALCPLSRRARLVCKQPARGPCNRHHVLCTSGIHTRGAGGTCPTDGRPELGRRVIAHTPPPLASEWQGARLRRREMEKPQRRDRTARGRRDQGV